MAIEETYLAFTKKQFLQYKVLAEKAIAQIEDDKLFVQVNEESNSIAMIVQHMAGNMLSRWTNFLTEDGEKEWRKRDAEFEVVLQNKAEMLQKWEKGWQCLFDALDSLAPSQLGETMYIRGEALSVLDAIIRQLAHYPYHVGQIVFLAKMFKGDGWHTLSMPKKK
jgi:hypothetical protein